MKSFVGRGRSQHATVRAGNDFSSKPTSRALRSGSTWPRAELSARRRHVRAPAPRAARRGTRRRSAASTRSERRAAVRPRAQGIPMGIAGPAPLRAPRPPLAGSGGLRSTTGSGRRGGSPLQRTAPRDLRGVPAVTERKMGRRTAATGTPRQGRGGAAAGARTTGAASMAKGGGRAGRRRRGGAGVGAAVAGATLATGSGTGVALAATAGGVGGTGVRGTVTEPRLPGRTPGLPCKEVRRLEVVPHLSVAAALLL